MRLALLLALVATPALAQSALKKHDTNAPIDINAARIEVADKAGLSTWTGDVRVKQGDLNLNADQVKLHYYRKGDTPVISRLDAVGAVQLTSPSERATAAYGIYDVERRLVTLTGNVVLNQNQSVLRGSRLVIDLENGRSTLDGRASAAAPGVGQPSEGGRVSGRFVVPERKPQ
jgi:lipopolysaccharide export system protein LptA